MSNTDEATDPAHGGQGGARKRRGLVGWITSHPKTSIAIAIPLLAALACIVLDLLAKHRLQAAIDAVRAAGAPTTLDELNAAAPDIADDENMALAVLAYAEKFWPMKIPEEMRPLLQAFRSHGGTPSSQEKMTPARLEAARWYLDRIAEPLAGIHAALRMQDGCLRVRWTSPTGRVELRGFVYIKQAVGALMCEAVVAAFDGDAATAHRVLLDSMHLSTVLDHNPTVLSLLHRIGCSAMTFQHIAQTINLCELDETQLATLQAGLSGIESRPHLKKAIINERVLFIDGAKWDIRNKPKMHAMTTEGCYSVRIWWLYMPALPEWDAVTALEVYAKVIDAIQGPSVETIEKVRSAVATLAPRGWSNMLSSSMLDWVALIEYWVRHVAQNRALQAALACERHRLAAGEWPVTLDVLVPKYLDAVPVDPFDDQPIRYAHIDEGIKVWSIGEDLTDNGGDVLKLERPNYEDPPDYGWVLLNPDLRGRPAETPED